MVHRSSADFDDYGDVEAMLVRLARAGSEEERRQGCDRIVGRCLPLADHIAYKFVGKGEPYDDLCQVARLGLVKAVHRYDQDKGRFLAFAVPTIMGEVRRYFRDNTWGMHVPRGLKQTHQRMRAVTETLSQRLGRAPTATELAAELGVDRKEVVGSIGAAYAYRPLSLDGAALGDSSPEAWASRNHGVDDPRFERIDDALAVAALVSRLTEQENAIVTMRFRECLTQTEIAQQIGVSQVHVSRLLADILQRLRQRLYADRLVGCSAE